VRRADSFRDRLEQDTATGVLRPGEQLDEQGPAARFGVSCTPIREALLQLASAGLVVAHPRRGAFVATLGVRDVVERFEVMATLEGMCGRLAARRITERERAEFLAVHEACSCEAAGGDPDAYHYENERFHHAIYAASHNIFLAEQAHQLHKRLKPYRRLQRRARNRIMASFREHQAIVDAILAGDGELAERRLRDHVLIQGERLTDFVATLDTAAVA
jgi:DNA-binding GntR family transcriptional regulator